MHLMQIVTGNILGNSTPRNLFKLDRDISLALSAALHICLAAWMMWPSSQAAVVMPMQQVIAVELVAMQASMPTQKPEVTKSQPIIKPKAKNQEIFKKEKQQDTPTKNQETKEENTKHSASGETASDSDHNQDASTTEPIFNASYLNNPPPIYPQAAKRQNIEGKVLLKVMVSASGIADNVEVKTSSGSSLLDNAAIDAVRRWRFVPAKQNNIPVAANVVVPVVFKIE